MTTERHLLFLVASTREPGIEGNTEALARAAAAGLPADTRQTWRHLHGLSMPPFQDHRHDRGTYPMPDAAVPAERDLRGLLDDTLAATDLVFVAPVYWYSLPAELKLYLDHWSAFLRVPGLDFKARMAAKRFWLVTTSGNRPKAQPMIDSLRLCAEFCGAAWGGELWGQGGEPGKVRTDAAALAAAPGFLRLPG
ncbi:NAD(P)H-dependent oxidoreductase [Ideonella sp. DXS22W]|uniref:NAD(P)H-dependent oxidoreductase n=1 Tax=Pseudaquabacterium inlustre TaxID=2984192 RepID=A0ABU9CMS4_9BURK